MSPAPSLRCRSHRRAMLDLIDGVDSVEERERLVAHAEGCGRCFTELTRARELRRRIDSADEPEISAASEAAFIEQVMLGIDAAESQRTQRHPAGIRRPLPFARPLGAVALAAAAAAAFFMLYPRTERTPARAPEIAVAAPEEMAQAEPQPRMSVAPSLAFGASTPSIEQADFVRLLEAASSANPFDPKGDVDSEAWLAALQAAAMHEGVSHGTLTKAARRLLRRDVDSPFALLAARLLGPRADLRDRRLLIETLPRTGSAGAFALCERGDAGFKLLWKSATESHGREGSAAATQQSIEQALIQWGASGHPALLDDVDLSLNVPLASTLIAQTGRFAARRLLEQFLSNGDPRWLDPWQAASRNSEDLSDFFEGTAWGPRNLRAKRLLTAVEHAAFAPGLDFAVEALSQGAGAAALVALPGDEALAALMNAARAGLLRSGAEDRAWALFAQERSDDIVAFAIEKGAMGAERAAFVLSRLAVVAASHPAARWTLVELGLCAELETEDRVRALLLATEAGPAEEDDLEAEREHLGAPFGPRLDALTDSPEAELGAAAYLALWYLIGEDALTDSPLSKTLSRSGTLAVQHLRVVRELQRTRAVAARSL